MFTKRLLDVEKGLALLTVFLMPAQLAFHFWPSYAFVFGIRVDYLSPAIYLTDILIFTLLLLLFINNKQSFSVFLKARKVYVLFFLLFVSVNLLFSVNFLVSLWKWIKVFEIIFFAFYIYSRKSFIGENKLLLSLLYSSFMFSILGILHFLSGKTTGLFYFLGERSFNLSTPGIALVQIMGRDYLRAYSVFSHPNSLAGYLGTVILTVLYKKNLFNRTNFIQLIVCIVCFVLTFSLSSYISLFFVATIFLVVSSKNVKIKTFKFAAMSLLVLSLLFTLLPRNNSIIGSFGKSLTERVDLAFVSGRIISSKPFTGTGINTFIPSAQLLKNSAANFQGFQPVHNIFLLVFSETGILGLIIVFLFLTRLLNTKYSFIFMFIIVTGCLDHYWITLQQNMLLVSFFTGLSLSKIKL